MQTQQYLKQIERLDRTIQNKMLEIEQLDCLAKSITVSPKDVNVQSSGDKDRLGTSVCKIVDLEKEIEKLTVELLEKRKKIIKQIEGMEDTTYYHILAQRYVSRKDWSVIAVELGYTIRSVLRLHGKALQAFEKQYGYEYK